MVHRVSEHDALLKSIDSARGMAGMRAESEGCGLQDPAGGSLSVSGVGDRDRGAGIRGAGRPESARSAATGSRRKARRTGPTHAAAATTVRRNATATRVIGSRPETACKVPCSTCPMPERTCKAERQPHARLNPDTTTHRPPDMFRACSERQAHAELAGPLRNRIGM